MYGRDFVGRGLRTLGGFRVTGDASWLFLSNGVVGREMYEYTLTKHTFSSDKTR